MVRPALVVAIGFLCHLLLLARSRELPERCSRPGETAAMASVLADGHEAPPTPDQKRPAIEPLRTQPTDTKRRDTPLQRRLEATRIELDFDLSLVLPALQDRLWSAGRIELRADPAIEDRLRTTVFTLQADGTLSVPKLFELVLGQIGPEGDIVYRVRGDTVWLVPNPEPILRVHPVADLLTTRGSPGTFFNDDAEVDDAELTEENAAELNWLAEFTRSRCASGSWSAGDRSLAALGRNLVVSAPYLAQIEIAEFLDRLR